LAFDGAFALVEQDESEDYGENRLYLIGRCARRPPYLPLTPEREACMRRVPQVKVMRRALGLTQEDFATRFRIPLDTLQDWEQGKSVPDQATRAYLTVIARDTESVSRALLSRSEPSPG
jgi:putative transcriptional regulator